MTTKKDLIEEIKILLENKKQELNEELDGDTFPLLEDDQNEDSDLHEFAKTEFDKLLENHNERISFIDDIINFLSQNTNP